MAGVSDGQESLSKASAEYTVDYMALANASYEHEADIYIKPELRPLARKPVSHVTVIKIISPDKLFLVDIRRSLCIIFDMIQGRVLSFLPIEGSLWDAAILPNDTVAVSDYNNAIHFISTENNILKLQYSVSTRSPCFGIAYRNGKLAVSFTNDGELPSRVEVKTLSGNSFCVSSFNENNPGIPMKCPKYLAFDDNDHVFVTDVSRKREFERFALVRYSLDGKIKQAYSGWELYADGASICCAGQTGVFICDEWNSCIRLLSLNLGSSKVILNRSDGVNNPKAVCYCERSGRLYVWNGIQDQCFKVYNVKLQ